MIGTTVGVLMSWLMIHSDSLPCLIFFLSWFTPSRGIYLRSHLFQCLSSRPKRFPTKRCADDTFSIKQSNLYAFICVVHDDPAHCDTRRDGSNKFLDANLNTNVKISILRIVQWMPDEMQHCNKSASWSSSIFVLCESDVNVFGFETGNKQFGDITVSSGTFWWPFFPLSWQLVIDLMCEKIISEL